MKKHNVFLCLNQYLSIMENKRLLVFVDWYLPGFKAGGPISSVAGLAQSLQDDLSIYIVTADRDLGDENTYESIECNKWASHEKHQVMYLSPESQKLTTYKRIINEVSPNFLLINGIYSLRFSILPLKGAKKLLNANQIFIAPRGMLNAGALEIKPVKKKAFLRAGKLLGLYNKVNWIATSDVEQSNILQHIDQSVNVFQQSNFGYIGRMFLPSEKNENELKILFFGRISPIKNLEYALELLLNGKFKGEIFFDIVGPIEDLEYWRLCKMKAKELPDNIHFNYRGTVQPQEKGTLLAEYNVLFLPTKNENFGQVILESLQVGLLVLISDQTPWSFDEHKCGRALPLGSKHKFIQQLEDWLKLDKAEFKKLNEEATIYALKKYNKKEIIDGYMKMWQ